MKNPMIARLRFIDFGQVLTILLVLSGCAINRPKSVEAWQGWDDRRADVVERLRDSGLMASPEGHTSHSRGMLPKSPVMVIPLNVGYTTRNVLIIAESEYGNGWASLPGVRNDAQLLTEFFEESGFTVDVLENASGPDLRESIHRFLAEHHDSNGIAIVWYLGHGYTQTQAGGKQVGYLVPIEAPLPDIDPVGFRTACVPLTFIDAEARSATIHHAIFMFDCCFAGTIFDALPRISMTRNSVADLRSLPVRQFLSAGNEKQTVPDTSIFTPLVIRALNGDADENNDGVVTGSELGQWVTDQVTKQSKGKQTPLFGNIRDPAFCMGDLAFRYSKKNPLNGDEKTSSALDHQLHEWRSTRHLSRFSPASHLPIAKPVWAAQYGQDDYGVWADLVVANATQRFRFCLPGNIVFQHRTLNQARGFWLADSECSQAFWKAVMNESPSFFTDRTDLPVERISYVDVQRCCTHLRTILGIPLRLPTLAEWQYVAAVGSSEMPEAGWHRRNSRLMTQPVRLAAPNIWGIHDLLGNVAEWCESIEEEKPKCGGSWDTPPNNCNPLSVGSALPEVKSPMTGCRLLIE